jgi:hypothetical protein
MYLMFGSKKKVLQTGTSAQATVIGIGDTGMTINNNPRIKLTLQVQADGQPAFQATKTATVSRLSIPRVGDTLWVRYDPKDPSKIEFDANKGQQDLAAAQADARAQSEYVAAKSEHDAMELPPDLAANGIRGRGSCKAVEKIPEGNLVRCNITVGVRLVDGTPLYEATCEGHMLPERAAKLQPQHSMFAVCADSTNHMRIALVPGEPIPVAPLPDNSPVEPALRALTSGDPCTVKIVDFARQYLSLPDGDELYTVKGEVDGLVVEAPVPVPPSAADRIQVGAELPAKRLAYEPNSLAIDWQAA